MTEKQLIDLCLRENRKAQQSLYDKYSPKMFGVCKRYVKNREDAEDVLITGFYKVFSNLKRFRGKRKL